MAPSASKQKRMAEKAAKNSASSKTTPSASVNGGSTPLTSLSANGSTEDLVDAAEQMRKLNLATDRSAVSCPSKVERRVEWPSLVLFAPPHEAEQIGLTIRTVSLFPTQRVEISRLISTLCLSTVDF